MNSRAQLRRSKPIIQRLYNMSASSVTPALLAHIQAAVAAIPETHQLPPVDGEVVEDPDIGRLRLQDWAFVDHFALMTTKNTTGDKSQGRRGQMILQCIHHDKETQNYCKINEENQKQVGTTVKAKNCKLQLDIHFIKKTERWSVVWVYNLHSHPQNPDPFIYTSYQSCHPGHQKAVELATTHHDELSYAESS